MSNEREAKRISGHSELDAKSICYWRAKDGLDGHAGKDVWLLYLPGCGLGDLSNHTVTEHEDGKISVTPSILVTGHEDGKSTQVHGYLTNGVWRDC